MGWEAGLLCEISHFKVGTGFHLTKHCLGRVTLTPQWKLCLHAGVALPPVPTPGVGASGNTSGLAGQAPEAEAEAGADWAEVRGPDREPIKLYSEHRRWACRPGASAPWAAEGLGASGAGWMRPRPLLLVCPRLPGGGGGET